MPWVMDCSLAAALGLPDEQSENADAFLRRMTDAEVWVPSLWWHEIGNVIASARLRKRITDNDASGLIQLYDALPVHTCVFRRKSTGDSNRSRHPIPIEVGT